MAPPKKPKAAAAAPAAPSFDFDVLKIVVDATRSPAGFTHYSKDALAPLVTLGYVETAEGTEDASGNVAVRAVDPGFAAYDAHVAAAAAQPAAASASPFGGAAAPAPTFAAPAPTFAAPAPVATQAPAAAVASSTFKVLTGIPIPAAKRFGKASVYPFDSLAVGACFVKPATADVPQPHKSLASTVNSANGRYATTDGSGAVTGHTRHFVLRNVPDGKDFGYPGVRVAVVWRDV